MRILIYSLIAVALLLMEGCVTVATISVEHRVDDTTVKADWEVRHGAAL